MPLYSESQVYGGLQDLQEAQSQFGPQANMANPLEEEETLEEEQARIIREHKLSDHETFILDRLS